jgi:hypothetical protein
VAPKFTTSVVEDAIAVLRNYKTLAEGAMAQVTDEELRVVLDPEMNSIALIVKHVVGNMRSRWTDFLTTDGEKPTRDRESEFRDPLTSRDALLRAWHEGWALVFGALESLTDADLTRTITIRGEAHSVLQAITRQLAHYAYHVGQIVFVAKHLRSTQWKSLSIPRGGSVAVPTPAGKGGARSR